jgi:hypothetical protein
MASMAVSSYQNISWDSMSNFTQFLSNANASGAGYLFPMIDFLVFFVLLISLSGAYGWEAGLLSAGFIGIILSLLFSYMGVMAWSITGIFVGLILFAIMYIVWSRNG